VVGCVLIALAVAFNLFFLCVAGRSTMPPS
jgi:hypothetical protein